MSQPGRETPPAAKARRVRNWALAAALFAFVIVVFVVTMIRLSGNVPPP